MKKKIPPPKQTKKSTNTKSAKKATQATARKQPAAKTKAPRVSTKTSKELIESEKHKTHAKPFPIVAIGASAGGLEAVRELLTNLSPNTGMSYVYIQHLSPDHESMLSTLLGRATEMPVLEAKDKLIIERNNVYIIPPNKEMYILDGVLRLNARPERPTLSMPINRFFISLAEKQKQGAIGIVLSGNASDGALGLRAIKSAGGFTFAQDTTAKFNSMPKSAVAEGAVDLVLPPKKIAKELERLSENPTLLHAIMDDEVELKEASDDTSAIIQLLGQTHHIDFSHYKQSTIHRRIIRRMLLQRLTTLPEYYKYLLAHKPEVATLYNDLLINVTNFFRDSASMDFLAKEILPRIAKKQKSNEEIRIWVPACSTGQEAYSIAMMLVETLGDRIATARIQIFATDLSESAINVARMGIYTPAEMENVSELRLKRFFTKTDSNYRIAKSIRDLCIFAPHNLLRDPPFSRLDLISCCNLFIYLDTTLQKKALTTFHYALHPGGYLLLGKSESIGTAHLLFTQLDKKIKAYASKKDGKSRTHFEVDSLLRPSITSPQELTTKAALKRTELPNLDRVVDQMMLSRFIPASVVINQEMDILQFRGSTGKFLEPAQGKASFNLLKMARTGLSFELRSTVAKSIKLGEAVVKTGIEVKQKQGSHFVNIEVVPLQHEEEPLYLVVFQETPAVAEDAEKSSSRTLKDKRIAQLEAELMAAREDMRSIIEEQEAVNEELQSANEEAVSSNEELQSINEELETSKEEVESSNEELMTMNSEILMRNDQLSEAYDYADAVLTTLREALLVLDKDLRIISANRTFYKIFKTSEESTINSILFELADGQWNLPSLRLQLQSVISENTHFENYEVELDFPQIGNKVMVLNGRKLVQQYSKQELVLLAIEDITEHVLAQRLLREREEYIRNIANNAPVMVWTSDKKGNRNFFNQTWLEFTGKSQEELEAQDWKTTINPVDREAFLKTYYAAVQARQPFHAEYRLQRHDGAYRWVMSYAKPMINPGGGYEGFIGTITEIHDQRAINEELERRVMERTISLEQTNNSLQQFAFISSHDLQEPSRKIRTFINLIRNKDLPPDQVRQYLDKINEASERMTALIRSILDYSRLPMAESPLEMVDLNNVLDQVLHDFELLIEEKQIDILRDPLPIIRANAFQMSLLFSNLISNAIKFSDVNPRIEIRGEVVPSAALKKIAKVDPALTWLQLSVIDNGIGFDIAYKDKIFELFQRLHGRNEYAGTGIGLSIVKKIINQHHAYIDVISAPGKGSRFIIWFPMPS
jgi:two-component system CheB/CheR fusion protein